VIFCVFFFPEEISGHSAKFTNHLKHLFRTKVHQYGRTPDLEVSKDTKKSQVHATTALAKSTRYFQTVVISTRVVFIGSAFEAYRVQIWTKYSATTYKLGLRKTRFFKKKNEPPVLLFF